MDSNNPNNSYEYPYYHWYTGSTSHNFLPRLNDDAFIILQGLNL